MRFISHRYLAVLFAATSLALPLCVQAREINKLVPPGFSSGASGSSQLLPNACLKVNVGTGSARSNQALAEVRSRARWEDVASGLCNGKRQWHRAVQQDVTCRHDGKSPAKRIWTCDASALARRS